MTSRPRVYTRIRPQNENEKRQDGVQSLFAEKTDTLIVSKENGEQVKTRFDHVFDTNTTQDDVFSHVGTEVLNTLFSGYNASVFAYGQTGSGKTHTMQGDYMDKTNRGLIPRFITAIFDKFSNTDLVTDASVQLSFVQIYQERVQDLFQQRKQLEIHLDRSGQYVAVGAEWKTVKSFKETMVVYEEALKYRATNATEMNLVSSRSHTIMMLKLQWDEPSLPGSHAQLNLIDLAGSEKLYQSGATGEVMKEAIAINKSLSALGNVVSKLVDAAKFKDRRVHVPYKDSKLTYLLQSSLGGSNLVHFILALSASSLFRTESQATVEFGKRALQLVIRPVRNPIDYKRLEEMEAMIEKMRDHIRNLEEEVRTKSQGFLQIKQIHQEGEGGARKAKKREKSKRASELRVRTELNRIVANLPETLEDLTSHCVLFPASKADFRNMSGLEKLIHFIDKSPSTFYKAHAAHTVSHVIDDEGRDVFGANGGVEALERLLLVKEERCKEAACVAVEAVVRNHAENKAKLSRKAYEGLVELIDGYANQQVQEAACTALASIVDLYPDAKKALEPLDVVRKLLNTIRDAPEEVVHVTKGATTCIGRLAHGDTKLQADIRKLDGITLLIDDVLFSPVGDRDHQVPILASYALVNLCCSNADNMAVARKHNRYDEVRFRLMEGLARAFGNNTVREGFGRATAQETTSPFPYHGVTVTDKWTSMTCGGRPVFSTFMENPQFHLYITERDTKVSLMIQDVLYEARMQQKQRNNTVYMGLAIFNGDPELASAGLKQLDFHGKMVDIAKFTSNCENVLHCTLKKSDTPYVVVPFTSQRGRTTSFALSAFGDQPLDLTQVPDTTGWQRFVTHGKWDSALTAGGDGPSWRNNPQVFFTPQANTRVVFILSFLSLDLQRSKVEDGAEEERANNRPRLHGRVFTHDECCSDRRYTKAFIPLPQTSTFVASNSYSSNSYITVTATLQGGQTYVFVPFTDAPCDEEWRLCAYSENDVEVAPLVKEKEWSMKSFSGTWKGESLRLAVKGTGSMNVLVMTEHFIRVSCFGADQTRIAYQQSFWYGESVLELKVPPETALPAVFVIEAMEKVGKQVGDPAKAGKFDVFLGMEKDGVDVQVLGAPASGGLNASTLKMPDKNSFGKELYPETLGEGDSDPLDIPSQMMTQASGAFNPYESDEDDYSDSEEGAGNGGGNAGIDHEVQQKMEMAMRELRSQLDIQLKENKGLSQKLKDTETQLEKWKKQALDATVSSAQQPHTPPTVGAAAKLHPMNQPTSGRGRSGSSDATGSGALQPVVRTASMGSRGGARKASQGRPGTSEGPLSGSGSSADTAKIHHECTAKLASISSVEKAPSAAEWARHRREIRDIINKLSASGN